MFLIDTEIVENNRIMTTLMFNSGLYIKHTKQYTGVPPTMDHRHIF